MPTPALHQRSGPEPLAPNLPPTFLEVPVHLALPSADLALHQIPPRRRSGLRTPAIAFSARPNPRLEHPPVRALVPPVYSAGAAREVRLARTHLAALEPRPRRHSERGIKPSSKSTMVLPPCLSAHFRRRMQAANNSFKRLLSNSRTRTFLWRS